MAAHPYNLKRFVEAPDAVLEIEGHTLHEIFGSPDDLEFRSSMTLFNEVAQDNRVFAAALAKFPPNRARGGSLGF